MKRCDDQPPTCRRIFRKYVTIEQVGKIIGKAKKKEQKEKKILTKVL